MDPILQQVKRARRRLWVKLFLNRMFSCVFVGLACAVVVILVPKLVAIEGLPEHWELWVASIGLGLGTLVALTWTLLYGRSELDAAMEIDRRFGLQERIASSLSLRATDLDTPAGKALLADASRAIQRVEVSEQFRFHFSRQRWLPLVTACAAFLLVSTFDDRPAESTVDPATTALEREQVDNAAEALRKRLAERRREAVEKGLSDAEGLLQKLEKETEKLAKTNEGDRQQALIKLNELSTSLEKRREELGGEEQLRKDLAKMKDFQRGPAEKMLDAMKKGDWQAAQQELKKLQEKLDGNQLDSEAQQELQQQLQQLQDKLAEAASARQQAMDQLQQQIEQQRAEGNLAEAGKLQQQLDQLRQQQMQMSSLPQIQSQLGNLQQALEAGDSSQASEAMQELMQQMDQMQQQLQEGEMLSMAMDEMQMAKDAMACSSCQGEGCEPCQSGMPGSTSDGTQAGQGIGVGRGIGSPDDQEENVKLRDSRVPQKPGAGPAVMVGEADGPNLISEISESIKEQMTSEGSTPADPQVIDQLPTSRREHAEEYFNLLREGF